MHDTARHSGAVSLPFASSALSPDSALYAADGASLRAPLAFSAPLSAADGAGRFILPVLLAPALLAVLAPFGLVAEALWSNPAARAVVVAQPWVAVQLAAGLCALLGLFGWPLMRLVRAAARRRQVTIADGFVHARTTGLFGARAWSEPLLGYEGVVPRVRSSLSGVHHELVLVHRRPARCVVVEAGTSFFAAAPLSAPPGRDAAEIPSRMPASVSPAEESRHQAEPQPELAAA